MKLTKQQEAEVMPIYKEWWHSYMNGDVKTYDHYLDDQYRFVGSTEAEHFLNKRDTTQFFDATADQLAGKSQLRNSKLTAEYYDGVVFITELADAYLLFGDEWTFYGKFRFSSMLRKKSDGWRFIYQHFSVPDSKAQEGETIGFEQVSKENQDLRDAIKRRTAELESKNRELEIEAALERVRARTMGMQKSAELKEVVKVIFDQLALLCINAEHAGIVVDYEPKKDWHFWIAETQDIPAKVTVPYLDLVWDQQFTKAKKADEHFFTTQLNFDEKNSFYKKLLPHIEGLTEKARDFYFSCPGLAISTVIEKDIGLYIENFSGTPYSWEENDILKRFGKVFQQAYTRFLDLQKAEAQAREAQIEAALERVRSRSMAMHKSDELLETGVLLFKELSKLEVNIFNCGYVLMDDEAKMGWNYGVNPGDGSIRPLPTGIPQTGTKVLKAITESWKKQEPFLLIELDPQETIEHQTYMAENMPNFSLTKEQLLARSPERLVIYTFNFKHGYLLLVGGAKLTADQQEMVMRFANVFEQTYTRFLDLQKAEAQAREAQIEAALERVRSRSLAMHKTDELQEVVRVVAEELKNTGVILDTWGAVICTYFQDSKDVIHWTASEDPANPSIAFLLPYFEDVLFDEAWASKDRGDSYFAKVFSFEVKNAFFKHAFELSDYRQLPDDYKKLILESSNHGIAWAWAKNSAIMIPSIQGDLPSEEEMEILIRFARVFEQSFIRFLDLKKAEAQAREAQIELSLEKIRAQVASMQESTDLLDIMVNIRSEFVSLGHDAHYFWYMRWLPDKYEKAMTSGDGTQVGMVMSLPRHIHGDIPLVANWELGEEPTLIFPMEVDTAVEYVDKMITLGDFVQVDPQAPTLDDIRHIEGLTFVMARTSQGEIGYSLPGYVPNPSPEAVATLARFAGVFDLAYKRFEDLKKAEKDLVEIKEAKKKAEEALAELKSTQSQLIHSEKMASLGELTAGIAHEIQNPLNFVNNFSEVNIELMEELKAESSKLKGERDEALEAELWQDLQENEKKINHHGKRADAIVKSMLQHSRAGSGQKEPTDINALADEYLRLSYHGLRAKDKAFSADFMTELEPALPRLKVIPQDIGRVLLNLINNAFHAVSEKAKKGIPDYKPLVTVKTKKHDHLVEIRVKDNGDGIPDDIVNKIFQPFFTTKPTGEGTGLGLSLSYDIVTKGHNGTLEVDTAAGLGSEFIIQLPIV